MNMVFAKSSCRLGKVSSSWAAGRKLHPLQLRLENLRMLVPGMFLIGGIFKSPKLNAFSKLELLKTLLSFHDNRLPHNNQCEAAVCISHT